MKTDHKPSVSDVIWLIIH